MKKVFTLLIFYPLFLFSQNSNFLDINQVKTMMSPDGFMHWDPSTQNAQYEVPKGLGRHSVYVSGVWLGGLDSVNNLYMSAQEYYGYDFWPGPLDSTNGTIDAATSLKYNKIWNIRRYKIEEFKYYFALGMVQNGQYIPDSSIITWPAHGTGNYSSNLAPFIDVNGNGVYDPITGGDYPDMKGDQMLYWILNDNLAAHTGSGGNPLKIEIHVSAYAFTCPQLPDSLQVLNYTTLYNFKIINRGEKNYHDTYITYWQDLDLGNWQDNFLGCYPERNYIYAYNADSLDDLPLGYGDHPPILSTIVLNGPNAEPNDNIDNNNNGTIDESGEKNLLSGYLSFNGGCCFPSGSATSPVEHYYYMTGRWQDGTPMTYGGNGYGGTIPTRHLYPDFPYDTSGWSAYTEGNLPSDTKVHISSGPFSFASKDTVDFDFAIVWSRDTSLPWLSQASFNKNLKDNEKIQQWFATDSFPSCLSINISAGEINSQENSLNVFPNPSSDIINIRYKPKTNHSIVEIIDITGRKVMFYKNRIFGWHEKQINISTLPQGLYLLKVTDGELQLTKRFVKNQ